MRSVGKVLSLLVALALCFSFLPLVVSAQGSSPLPETIQETVTITYDFHQPTITGPGLPNKWFVEPKTSRAKQEGELADKLGNEYFSVEMEGLPQWEEAGLPILPFQTARILLPYGQGVEGIKVTPGQKVTLPGSYHIVEPGQESVHLSYEGEVEPTPPNAEVYSSSDPFPGELYSDVSAQSKSGYRILLLNLHPVEYIPQTGKLSCYKSITVEVDTTSDGDEGLLRGLPGDREIVRDMVDNPEVLDSYPTSSPLSETYAYVIITNEDLKGTPGPNNLQALRDEKISRGITATIVTTEWIYANYDGTRPDGDEDDQTRIRNFIIDYYTNYGTNYILLAGDGDGADVGDESGDEIIPHRGFASISGEIDYDIPADMYYACLDGSFDYDADGIYGEPNDGLDGGEVDLFAEVYVGRACVDSQEEVQNFVAKTFSYQSISSLDENLRKIWMVGEYLGFGGVANWGGNYKDEIKEGSCNHGYCTIGFEDSAFAPCFDVSTLYDRDGYWPKGEIIDIINDNTHLINHLGHANVGYVMKMRNPDVDALTNEEMYFIGYSQGCYCGAFDNRDPGGSYTSYDCISEHLTAEAHGAVAFIANSRYGWGTGGSTDGPSQHYDREFWDAVWGEDILNIGIANQDSKEDNAGRIGSWVDRWCYYEINLFGDPELAIKLEERVAYDSHEIDDRGGGDGDSYPEPGEFIEMPVTLRNTSTDIDFTAVATTLSATTFLPEAIFSEDFEGDWPANWIVGDWNPESGEDYWGQSDNWPYTGSYSAYCAEELEVPAPPGGYNNDMDAYMYQEVDLSGYDFTILSYYYWLDCQRYYDHLDVGYYDPADSSWHWVKSYTGYPRAWTHDSLSIPVTATKAGFLFHSNSSVISVGAYIDDVAFTGYTLSPDPYITIFDNYEEYGDIPAGGTATSLGDYDFIIAPNCPIDHMVTFNLDITATNGGPWTASFTETVVIRHTVSGQLRDLETGEGIADAIVYYSGPVSGEIATGEQGYYLIIGLPGGTYSAYASAEGYSNSYPVDVTVEDDVVGVDFELGYSDIGVSPSILEATLLPGQTAKQMVTISNTGNFDLLFNIGSEELGLLKLSDNSSTGALHSGDVIEAQWAGVTPTLDGAISEGEWDDAVAVDITASGISNPVTLYVKNNRTHLYMAFVDTNDASLSYYDQIGIYFDEDHDGQWQSPPSSDSEGNLWLGDFGSGGIPADVIFRSLPDFSQYPDPAGVSGALDDAMGYVVHEVAIEFGTSPLDCEAGDTIGLWVYILDSSGWVENGIWPESSIWYDPSTYGDLNLVNWLIIDPLSGTVVPGESMDIIVTFDATGMEAGDYYTNIIVQSNDPDEPESVVRAHLRVLSIDYDSHEIDDSVGGDGDGYPEPGESISMPVTLRNSSPQGFTNVAASLSATTLLPETVFSEDMEADEGEWTYDGLWHLSEHRSYSATHSWYYGMEGQWNYDTGTTNAGSLTSPPIDLTGFDEATLSFWYWYETESEGAWWDQRWVRISVNGGPFQNLQQLFEDPMQMWNKHTIDLSSYVGNTIQIMFYFDTIDEVANYFEGWYIDDIIVTGFALQPDPYITITSDYAEFGDMPAGSTATGLPTYEFDIDPECPVDHVVIFNLGITTEEGAYWTDSFTVTVVQRYTISGQVTDLETREGIADAIVHYSGPVSGEAATGEQGYYMITGLPEGIYIKYASAAGYCNSDPVEVTLPPDDENNDFELGYSDIQVSPEEMEATLFPNGIGEQTLTISNVGNYKLTFDIRDESTEGLPPPDFGAIHFNYDVEGPSGDFQCLGVEFNGEYFYVTGGNSGGEPNKVHVFDRDGNYSHSFDQESSSYWGWRDLAWDGEYLYSSDSSEVIQFTTDGTVVDSFPGPGVSPCRALAYDPETDHFWTANWGSPIYEFDKDGNVINTFSNDYAIYGMAWDDVSPDGPWLWVFAQEGWPGVTVYQFDPVSGVYTDVSFISWDGFAGGACFTTEWDPVYGILVVLCQARPDSIVGHEICLAGCPWLDEDPSSGIVEAGESMDITVTFDATGLEAGDYYANIIIESNDPDEPETIIPVHLQVVLPEPDIRVEPSEFEVSLPPDTTWDDIMNIFNDGTAELAYEVWDTADWLSENPESGTVAVDSYEEITVSIDTAGLEPGHHYDAAIVIQSNDPDEPQVIILVHLTVYEM